MRSHTLLATCLLASGCGALAGGSREESAGQVPVILPPPEDDGPTPIATAAPARRPATLSRVPVRPGHEWSGQYACLEGAVDFRVRVEAAEGSTVRAVFELPGGRYAAAGEYDADSGALELQPTEAPAGVPRIGLYGTVSEGGALYEGRVTDPSCRWFTLRGAGR